MEKEKIIYSRKLKNGNKWGMKHKTQDRKCPQDIKNAKKKKKTQKNK